MRISDWSSDVCSSDLLFCCVCAKPRSKAWIRCPDMLLALYLIAITAEAMTAALAAGRRDMDWIGVCIIACVTALGGGTLRDVVLGHYPVTWVLHPEMLWITAGATLCPAQMRPRTVRLGLG